MKKVILLASEELCDILRYALGTKYITLPCSSPDKCMELFSQDPDILILDLSLSGYDGLAFLAEKPASRHCSVIAMTRFLNENLMLQLAEFGIAAVLLAPFRSEYLNDVISKKSPS